MTVYGVDLSHFNTMPALDGYGFAFLKCTQGTSFVDSTYAARQPVVTGAGIVCGSYHFGTMAGTATEQAAWFAQHANIVLGDVVILDWEDDGTWGTHSTLDIATQANALMLALLALYPDNRVLLYCNTSTWENVLAPHGVTTIDGLWDAAYRATPPPDPWLFWQYSDTPVDHDQESAFATLPDLINWSHKMSSPINGVTQDQINQWTGAANQVTGTFFVTDGAHPNGIDPTLIQAVLNDPGTPADLVVTVKALLLGLVAVSNQLGALQKAVAALPTTQATGQFTLQGSGTIG
jgi:hypothetical protein